MSDQPSGSQRPSVSQVTARIDFNYPEVVPTYYARLFSAQADQHEIILSLFDPRMPVFSGTSEEINKQAAAASLQLLQAVDQ